MSLLLAAPLLVACVAKTKSRTETASSVTASVERARDGAAPAAPTARDENGSEPVGTPGRAAEPEGEPEHEPSTQDGDPPRAGFSRSRQTVGTPTDGVELLAIHHAAHDGFHRFVFDLSDDAIPSTEASLFEGGTTLVIDLHGLRHDATGNRPLTTESGRPFGKPIAVRAPPIRSYGRAQVLDDSQIRYEIHLEHAVSFRLSARRGPPRIVVDIAR